MNISFIPSDVIIFIFKYLDLDSKLALYEVCKSFLSTVHFKYLSIRSYKLLFTDKRWTDILNHSYLCASKEYLVKLDISGMQLYGATVNTKCDEFRSELTSAITTFPNLRDLNIGYTQLTMPDSLKICPHLPKLDKLSVNFEWPGHFTVLTDEMLMLYRYAFRNIEYLHFIGEQDILLDSHVLWYMSDPGTPKELRLTFIDIDYDIPKYYTFDGLTKYDNARDKLPYKKMTLENFTLCFLKVDSKFFYDIHRSIT